MYTDESCNVPWELGHDVCKRKRAVRYVYAIAYLLYGSSHAPHLLRQHYSNHYNLYAAGVPPTVGPTKLRVSN